MTHRIIHGDQWSGTGIIAADGWATIHPVYEILLGEFVDLCDATFDFFRRGPMVHHDQPESGAVCQGGCGQHQLAARQRGFHQFRVS